MELRFKYRDESLAKQSIYLFEAFICLFFIHPINFKVQIITFIFFA